MSNGKKVFFHLAGLGFGNASRISSVIDVMKEKDSSVEIMVFTWGRGYDFLKQQEKSIDLRKILSYAPGQFRNYSLQLLVSAILFLPTYIINSFYLLYFYLTTKPKLAIFDSDYHFFPAILSGARRVTINQSPFIQWLSRDYSLQTVYSSGAFLSYLCEKLDYGIQRIFSDLIICPSLNPSEIENDKDSIVFINPVVRPSFQNCQAANKPRHPVGVILSGFASKKEYEQIGLPSLVPNHKLKILEAHDFEDYDGLITNCGFSSLSEALCLKKKILLLPIPGSWEQRVLSDYIKKKQYGREFEPGISPDQDLNRCYQPFDGAQQILDNLMKL